MGPDPGDLPQPARKITAAAMTIAAAGAVLVSSYFAAQMFWLPKVAA